MVNQQRHEEGRLIISRNCVMSHFAKMKPKIVRIKKCCQGNTANIAWQQARMNQTLQYLVMLGKYDETHLVKLLHTAPIPPCFHPKHLPVISKTQLVFWDETHISQEGGLPSRTGYCIRFPRDHNGKLCLDINDEQPTMYNDVPEKLTFKYGKEIRFCLGVAAVQIQEGVIKGVKRKSFSYTGTTLVTLRN
jgi:hypothetical protein